MKKSPTKLYYDGTCSMCTAFAESVKKKSPDQELIDASKPQTNTPAPQEALLKDMHLVEAGGIVRTGPDAILTSLTYGNKLYWPLSRLVRVWPISAVAKMIYRLVAKHRHALSRRF